MYNVGCRVLSLNIIIKASSTNKQNMWTLLIPRRSLPRPSCRCWRDRRNVYTRWSSNLEPLETSNWLHSGRASYESWCTIQHSSESGSSLSFPWAWKKEEIPSRLPVPTQSRFSRRDFMCGSAWKWSEGKALKEASPRNQESPNQKLQISQNLAIVHMFCIRGWPNEHNIPSVNETLRYKINI